MDSGKPKHCLGRGKTTTNSRWHRMCIAAVCVLYKLLHSEAGTQWRSDLELLSDNDCLFCRYA